MDASQSNGNDGLALGGLACPGLDDNATGEKDVRARARAALLAMTAQAFEAWTATYLRVTRGYQTRLTKASGDGGVDVELRRDAHRAIAQCKHTDTVGTGALRDFYGTMRLEQVREGFLVTTGRFTDGARDVVAKAALDGCLIHLLGLDELVETVVIAEALGLFAPAPEPEEPEDLAYEGELDWLHHKLWNALDTAEQETATARQEAEVATRNWHQTYAAWQHVEAARQKAVAAQQEAEATQQRHASLKDRLVLTLALIAVGGFWVTVFLAATRMAH
jgi:hypothetical protein